MTKLEMALIERVQELEKELFEAKKEIGILKDKIGDLNRFYKEGSMKRNKKAATVVAEEIKEETVELEAMDVIEAFAEALEETGYSSLNEFEFKQFEEELKRDLYQDELDRLEYMDYDEASFIEKEFEKHSDSWIVKFHYDKEMELKYHEYDWDFEIDDNEDEIPF